MSRWVLDASVAVAWYLPEAHSEAARRWRDQFRLGDLEFVVPRLHFWEFGNVLRTYVRRGELTAGLAHEVYELHLGAPFEVADPDPREVLTTALRCDATVYDAVYISLSRELQVPLLTAERPTTPWVVQLGDSVHSIVAS
jgi:predicted nucleic acid-binding protein